eukprot:scaffold2853_cov246-Pinguiococcus_pyrenoidosus.AAC.4
MVTSTTSVATNEAETRKERSKKVVCEARKAEKCTLPSKTPIPGVDAKPMLTQVPEMQSRSSIVGSSSETPADG